MKQSINFRLSKHSITVLSSLSESLELSKTDILERALQTYYEITCTEPDSPLMKFAGILGSKDAEDMLEAIYTSRIDSD